MRKLKQRLFSLLLCAALAVNLCPAALAGGDGEENVSYLDENGVEQVCAMAANASGIEWNTSDSPSGWYVVSRDVLIGKRVTVTGNVHLILKDGYGLTVNGGINVGKGQSLTIYAQSTDVNTMGKLTATGDGDSAGIGGGNVGNGGTITISGGTVTAVSNLGAGIGGGNGGPGGTITISGGTVTAVSNLGAGIGGGSSGGAGGTITIGGGEVTATSKGNGAGIGGGSSGAGGTITINGGTVTAGSAYTGAGIGGGSRGEGGTITITDGEVRATSQDGAGIGGGINGRGGTITISGGTVAVSSIGGACIGGGSNGAGGIVPSDLIEISDATVTRLGGGSLNIGPTEHEADQDTWSSDESSHWYPCKKEGCTDNHQFNKAAHTFGEWIIDTPAAATTAGSKHRTCGECGYKETETIPPEHSHSYGQAWVSDAAGHWHACSCGDKSGYAAHTFGEWTTTTEATATTAGSRSRTCGICQYQQTETIPATGGGSTGGESKPSGGGSSGGGSSTPTYRPDVIRPGEGAVHPPLPPPIPGGATP